ncbi:MAG TPA: DUF1861 family protein [Firmicutes bacterium]|nr:DUF1861 family protein [Bacillota bacterium]
MLTANVQPVSAKDLYHQFKSNQQVKCAEFLQVKGLEGFDVYNPSVPFMSHGEWVIAGRVERRDSEDSTVVFFREEGGALSPIADAPRFSLQDPFVTMIDGQIVFGGVRVIWENDRIVSWVTDFYRGSSIYDLKYFATGPDHMKDIRLLGLADGRIAVLTRPLGEAVFEAYGCIAMIGFVVIESLDQLSPEVIANAPVLHGHFLPREWGGANQLHLLKNGLIGVIGHIAYWEHLENDDHVRHYYSSAFALDPETRHMTATKVICSRDCFPPGDAKRPDLRDVTFTAGIVRQNGGTAEIYTGLNDCQIGRAVIPDPFTEYEQLVR